MAKNLVTPSTRLHSLDALRGFDMFWITSGEGLAHAWAQASSNAVSTTLSNQLHHSVWNGFTFYDLIFPLFIFIAGVAMPYSIGRQLENTPAGNATQVRQRIFWQLLKRTLILIGLGIIVNGLLQWPGYENTRFASVLGRIGLACFFAGCIYLTNGWRGQVIWVTAILIGYWAVMTLVPVPGCGNELLTPECNFAAYVDRLLLPGKLHRKVYDPEGLLSTLPAIVNALAGIWAGQLLKSSRWSFRQKAAILVGVGIICIGLAYLWNLAFPINKILWTSSFVVLTCGWSCVLLAIFYSIIDGLGFHRWAKPFDWIGTNSILIYLAVHGIINFESAAQFVFGGTIKLLSPEWQSVGLALGIVIAQLALLYFLYHKKWFLKI